MARVFKFLKGSSDIRRTWDKLVVGKNLEERIVIGYKTLEIALARETWKNGNRSPKKKKDKE